MCDYVIDCIDSLSCKVALVVESYKRGLKVASSMGAGNRLDPTHIKVADISKTDMCPLAKQMRLKLRKHHGIYKGMLTVFSDEHPSAAAAAGTDRPRPSARGERHHQLHAAAVRLHAGGCGAKTLLEEK